MTNVLSILFLLFFCSFAQAQVGIGTTNPQSSLDIVASNQATPATNDGILIPRVDEFPLINPGALQDGMLIFITGNGTATRGFHFWDNSNIQWNVLDTVNTDADWYQASTTSTPNNITDDIFTNGNVAIGKTAPIGSYRLDVEETTGTRGLNVNINGTNAGNTYSIYAQNNNTSTGSKYGIYSTLAAPSGANSYGLFSNLSTLGNGLQHNALYNSINGNGSGEHYGINNNLFGSGNGLQYGVFNNINNSGSGRRYGTFNSLSGTSPAFVFGLYNNIFNSGDGVHYGSYNRLAGSGNGRHYAIYNDIFGSGSGFHYGIFNRFTGSSNSNKYGSYNSINNSGSGRHFGSFTNISSTGTGEKYGSYILIGTGTGTNNYGIYSAVGIAQGYAGYFAGDVFTTGSYLPSDDKLKSNITNLDASLDKLMQLEVKTYNYQTENFQFMNLPQGTQVGFIAEELEQQFPALVKATRHPKSEDISNGEEDNQNNNDASNEPKISNKKILSKTNDAVDFKAVNYTGLVPYLVKALQEQQTIIEDLQARLEKLEK